MRILKRLAENRSMRNKFRRKPIRIRCVNKRIQPQVFVPRMIRHRRHTTFRLNKYLRPIPPDNRKKRTLLRRYIPRIKAKLLPIESNRLHDVPHNETR